MRCSRRRRPRTIWCWRRRCSPSARRRISPRRWRGSIARGCRRPRTSSIPARAAAAPARIAAAERDARPPRGEDRGAAPRSKKGKSSPRHGMAEGSVWFRAAIGRRKNAEARWLLPMICRRGGIDKHDIGAIRIMDTTTEFEISEACRGILCRQDQAPRQGRQHPHRGAGRRPARRGGAGNAPHAPRREGAKSTAAPATERPREERATRPHGEAGVGFSREPGFKKKKKFPHKAAHAGPSPHASAAKPGSGKKVKHRTRR